MHRASASSTSSSEAPAPAPDAARRGWRGVAAGIAVVVAATLAAALLWRDDLLWRANGGGARLTYLRLRERTGAWVARVGTRDTGGVVFGDSVFAMAPRVFVSALRDALDDRGHSADLLDAAEYGLTAFHHYYWLPEVLPGRPRFALVEVNLRTFAADWAAEPTLRMGQLSAFAGMRRAAAVRDALAADGVGLVDPFVYRLEHASGMLFVADGARQAVAQALAAAGTAVSRTLALPESEQPAEIARFLPLALDAGRAEAWYGEDFASRPQAAVLRTLLHELRAAGVVPLLVVVPVNRDRLAALGVAADLDARTLRLRHAIGARPEDWLAPTDGFRDADFRDAVHLRPLALERLAASVAERLAGRRGAPAGTAARGTP